MFETFTFAKPIPVVLFALILVAVLSITIFLYKKAQGINPNMRMGLIAMRVLVLILVVLSILEPHAIQEKSIERKQHLPVLLDISKSMSLKDQRKNPKDVVDAATALGHIPFNSKEDEASALSLALDVKARNSISESSRLQMATHLITETGKELFANLSKDVDINYYTFGETVDMLGSGDEDTLKKLGELKATQTGTSIADSLETVINARGGAPISGIVMISDGIDTTSRRTEAIVKNLGARGIPIYTVPIGINDPDDVSIRSIIMQDVAFTGDTVPVRVQVRSKGYEKRDVDLVLTFNGEELARETITLAGGIQYEDLAFDVVTKDKEAAEVEVVIEPFADESTTENNRYVRSLRIVNEKINVLCIEGSGRWEFRYLRAILKRDPRIKVKFVAAMGKPGLAQRSSDYIERFPEDPNEAFEYDLVILGDVEASFFTDAELIRLEELVRERGGSLLVLAGRRHTPSSYVSTSVEKMLPVRFDPDEEWRKVGDEIHPVLTNDGRSSLVMTLEHKREDNDLAWARVSPMFLVPPFTGVKQGATVLATLSDSSSSNYPLIAWQRYGTGKCMVIGTDNLWRLRYKTGDKYHWRVWSQCIQFLTLSRLMGEHKNIRIETDRVSYNIGSQVRVYASVLDESFEAITQPSYDVVVMETDEESEYMKTITLRPNPSNPGQYEGYFTPPKATRYRLEANEDDVDSANDIEFDVLEIHTEMSHPESQLQRLKNIAELSGGQMVTLTNFSDLSKLVNKEPHRLTVTHTVSLWDNWFVMILILGFVGVEWILRRKRNLA